MVDDEPQIEKQKKRKLARNKGNLFKYWLVKIKQWKPSKDEITLMVMITVIFVSSIFSSLLQSNFGNTHIEYIQVADEYGNAITGKLYRPTTATYNNPAPGIILCHGMNNDKDTEGPLAMELAKRGFVVIAVDQQNHGDSDIGSDVLGDFLGTSDTREDDTIGANAMYQYLKSAEFVDGTQMGIVGHSMGGSTARKLALLNPDHRAVIIQAGGPDDLTEVLGMNNYLDIWPLYEELFINPMESRADFLARGKSMIESNLDLIGETPRGECVDETYGVFANGTAQRYALCKCTHPGVTWNQKSIQESVAWMTQALQGETDGDAALLEAGRQTYFIKEGLMLFAVILLVLSLLPLSSILMTKERFVGLKTTPTEIIPTTKKEWWKSATINTLIGGFSFIFLPAIGMIALSATTVILPFFRLLTGNGSLFWLLINALICSLLFKKWFLKAKEEKGLTEEDIGIFKVEAIQEKEQYLVKTLMMVLIFFGYLYSIVLIIQKYLNVEMRYMWPILKTFTPTRFLIFLVYLLPVYLFFKINGGKFMYGQLKLQKYDSEIKTQIVWWLKYLFAMEAGLFLVFLIQYVPMFVFGTGPGLSAGILLFFFGLFGIFLMQTLPQFAVIFFVTTAFYRKTGKIYLGAFTATLLSAWIMAVSGQLV
ncbi:hypothetical protein NEF87_002025 [Candidatus Lokiarchaeum ossiferum]|uniref:Serine aminopeptidase S33 domain-containing protein n=1 Tax=Candidatus Lokiarchaeum ossiferum TaxID=2951803 RepID=A0ABY6HQR6_9ARCH|nr:hypothetical protein NEF87_002025 [Candidatus Lokiarchaeum sp. B-35]